MPNTFFSHTKALNALFLNLLGKDYLLDREWYQELQTFFTEQEWGSASLKQVEKSAVSENAMMHESWLQAVHVNPDFDKKKKQDALKLLLMVNYFASCYGCGRMLLGQHKQVLPILVQKIAKLVAREDFDIEEMWPNGVNKLFHQSFETLSESREYPNHKRKVDEIILPSLPWQTHIVQALREEQVALAKKILYQISELYSRNINPVELAAQGFLFEALSLEIQQDVLKSANSDAFDLKEVSDDIKDKLSKHFSLNNKSRKRHVRRALNSPEWQAIVMAHLSAEQVRVAKALLFAVSKLAALPPDKAPMSGQEHLFGVIFSAIVERVEEGLDYRDQQSLEAEAIKIYQIINAKFEAELVKQRHMYHGNRIANKRPLHELSHFERADEEHMTVLAPRPKKRTGIELLGPYKTKATGDKTLFNRFSRQDFLPRCFKSKKIKHILFPFGSGRDAHWRAVYIQKPREGSEDKYIVRLFDSYGPGGASFIKAEVLELMAASGVEESQIEVQCVDLDGLTNKQVSAYECGMYVLSYLHYLCQLIGGDDGGYDKHIVTTFLDMDISQHLHSQHIVDAVRDYSERLYQLQGRIKPQGEHEQGLGSSAPVMSPSKQKLLAALSQLEESLNHFSIKLIKILNNSSTKISALASLSADISKFEEQAFALSVDSDVTESERLRLVDIRNKFDRFRHRIGVKKEKLEQGAISDMTLGPNPLLFADEETIDLADIEEKVRQAITLEIIRLKQMSHSWWPFTFYQAEQKAEAIEKALAALLDKGASFVDALKDEQTHLYQSLNQKRTFSFTFWSQNAVCDDKSQALLNVEAQMTP